MDIKNNEAALNESIVEMEDLINAYQKQIKVLNNENVENLANLEKKTREYLDLQEEIIRVSGNLEKFKQQQKQKQKQQTINQRQKQQTINQRQRQSSTFLNNQTGQLKEQLKICESNYVDLYNQMQDKLVEIQNLQYNIKTGNKKIEQYEGIINENEIAYSELQQDYTKLNQNIRKFDRLKALSKKGENITENQKQEFRSILQAL